MLTGWDGEQQPARPEAIRLAVTDAVERYAHAYIVIEKADQHYIQTYHETRGFILEKREGGPDSHFRAHSLVPSMNMAAFPKLWERLLEIGPRRSRHFGADEIIASFCAYVEGRPAPDFIEWVPFHV